MERRTFLGTAWGVLAGLAGCSGRDTGSKPQDSVSPTSASPTSPRPLSSYGCPPYAPNLDGYVCSHTVDTASASVYLLPSQATAEASETIELTLHNESATALEFNPHQWTITRRAASGWESVEKRISGNAKLTVSPGDTHTWTLRQAVESINQQVTVDEGTYAAEIAVPNPDGSDWIRCLALVRLR